MYHYLKVGLVAGALILFGAGCAKQTSTPHPLRIGQPQPADNLPLDVEDLPPLPPGDDMDTDKELDEAEKNDARLPAPNIMHDEVAPPNDY